MNIWFPLPGDGDTSETPSAKKCPKVAKGTLVTSTIKCVNSTSTYLKIPCMFSDKLILIFSIFCTR